MIDFETTYIHVRPPVLRLTSLYPIQLWDKSDWDQEGMLVLYQLLVEDPRLRYQIPRLGVYFKTKFTNHVKDALRIQESQQRRFNKPCTVDISELAHQIPARGLLLDDYLAWKRQPGSSQKSTQPPRTGPICPTPHRSEFPGALLALSKTSCLSQ